MNKTTEHWSVSLLGKKWHPRAHGPEAYDCWTLVVKVYRDFLDIRIDEYSWIARTVTKNQVAGFKTIIQKGEDWSKVTLPEEFDLVLMSNQNTTVPHHCGLYSKVGGGRIVHCQCDVGVIASIPSRMLRDWNILGFYRYAKRC